MKNINDQRGLNWKLLLQNQMKLISECQENTWKRINICKCSRYLYSLEIEQCSRLNTK
jgi:hypothetical protein